MTYLFDVIKTINQSFKYFKLKRRGGCFQRRSREPSSSLDPIILQLFFLLSSIPFSLAKKRRNEFREMIIIGVIQRNKSRAVSSGMKEDAN